MTAPGYLQLVAENPSYRRLWLGEVVSYAGDWFSTIALYTIVQDLTDSAAAVSAVLVAKTLPAFFVMPLAGPLVDRVDRRTLLLATDVLRAVSVLGLIAAHHLGSLWLLYGVTVWMVVLASVFLPARSAALPDVTQEHELPVAMALSGGTWSVMLALGAAAGGVVTAWVGVDGSLLLDGATFLASAALLWGLPHLPPAPRQEGERAAGFVEGLRYLAGAPHVALLTVGKAVLSVQGVALAMLPLYGHGVFPGYAGPLWIGWLYALRGVGAAFGSLGLRKVVGDAPETMRRWLAPGLCVCALGMACVALAPSIWWAGAGYLFAAIGAAAVWVFTGTLLQQAAPRDVRGRVFSLEVGLLTVVISAVSVVAGVLVDRFGWTPDAVMYLGAATLVAIGLPWTLAVTRTADQPRLRASQEAAASGK